MRKWCIAVLFGVLVVGVVLRWWNVGQKSLWFDEGYTQWVAALAPSGLVEAIRWDFSPPGYFLAVSFWTGLFGDSEFAFRSLSALAGSLSLILVAVLAWRVTRSHLAMIIAAGFFALSRIQVEWSQTARTYALAALLFVLATWLLILYRETSRWIWLLLASLAGVALVYQHNVMWFYLAALNLLLVLWPSSIRWKQTALSILLFNVIVLACFVPWIDGFKHQIARHRTAYFTEPPVFYDATRTLDAQAGTDIEELRENAIATFGPHDAAGRLYRLPLFVACLLLIGIAITSPEKTLRRKIVVLLLVGFSPLIVGFFYSHIRPSVWVDKTFIPTSTILPVVFACALLPGRAVALRSVGAAALLLLSATAAISTVSFLRAPATEDWRAATLYASRHAGSQPACAIFVANECEMVYRYYTQHLHIDPLPATGVPYSFLGEANHATMTRVMRAEELSGVRRFVQQQRPQRLFLFERYSGWADPKGHTRAWLDSELQSTARIPFGRLILHIYEPRPVQTAAP